MTPSRLVPSRPRGIRLLLAIAIAASLLAACGPSPAIPSITPSASAAPASPSAPPTPTPSPSPTPQPTPRYTNEPDPALEALIPDAVAGVPLIKPAAGDFAMTPGDIGAAAYGELGLRFASLAIAYVERPRATTLYAMRVDGDPPTTEDLEPYLATAGRYVGIAGLHPEAWALTPIGDHLVWARPEDNATAAGTMIYTWAADGYVFLLIGVDDAIRNALLAALPGEPPPTPSPRPSRTPAATGSGAASGSAAASPSASAT
jgi:hypothetical protein